MSDDKGNDAFKPELDQFFSTRPSQSPDSLFIHNGKERTTTREELTQATDFLPGSAEYRNSAKKTF